ncbi:MAG: hypothetical protein RJA98_3725 [Pseudomonadota bacterium]
MGLINRTTPHTAALPQAQRAAQRGSWAWYRNRLSVMKPAEMLHRARHAAGRWTRRNKPPALPPPDLRTGRALRWLGAARSAALPPCGRAMAVADALLMGRWTGLDGALRDIGQPPRWHELQRAQPGDDVRHLMELHRHAHLVPLAQAYAATGRLRYRHALIEQLDSWMQSCPWPRGVAWMSALDAGLRLANWAIVWQLLGASAHGHDDLPAALRERWLGQVMLHAHHIQHNLSLHSSANNHLIGELLGLVVAQATWPHWPQLAGWAADAAEQLDAQTLLQNGPDGANLEQASWYQGFSFELLALHWHLGECTAAPRPAAVKARLAAMARCAAALRDRAGQVSHHGDADGATALGLVSEHPCALERMLDLAVSLQLAPELAPLLLQSPTLGPWFTGQLAEPARGARALAVRRSLPRRFDHGGIYLLGQDFGGAGEVMMTLDAGPLGYLSIAAHGHADALSVRLSVAGRQLLVDRGTGSYNTEAAWRQYFRGTLAHNTVCLDGADQSVYGGPFLWVDKATCTLKQFESTDTQGRFNAQHNGYQRLPGQPVHERDVRWEGGPAQRFTVTDHIRSQAAHQAVVAWHFAPDCDLTLLTDGSVQVQHDGQPLLRMQVLNPTDGHWTLHRGQADEFLGWHSPHLGAWAPATSLLWHTHTVGATQVTTDLQIQCPQGLGEQA